MRESRKREQAVIRGARGAAPRPRREDEGDKSARTGSEPSRALSEQELWTIVMEGHLRLIGKESDSETG